MAKKETTDVTLTLAQAKELLEDGAVKVKGMLIQMKDEDESTDDWQDIITVAEDAIEEIENLDDDEEEENDAETEEEDEDPE